MTGYSLNKNDILALKANSPKGVVDILTSEELSIFNSFTEECLHSYDKKELRMSLEMILSSVKKNIFDRIALPKNFPSFLKPIGGIYNEYSSDIGIVTLNEGTDIVQIKMWVIRELSNLNNIPKKEVSRMLKFEPRIWFDGPVSNRNHFPIRY